MFQIWDDSVVYIDVPQEFLLCSSLFFLCCCAVPELFSSLFWIFMKTKISFLGVIAQLSFVRFCPSPVCTKPTTGWHSPELSRKAMQESSYWLLNVFFFVYPVQLKRILHSFRATLPPLKVCIKPRGQDTVIPVALFWWRKTIKDEKHQSSEGCEEWLVRHVCWCLLAMHMPSAEENEGTTKKIITLSGFCFFLYRDFSVDLSEERGPEISLSNHIRQLPSLGGSFPLRWNEYLALKVLKPLTHNIN